MIKNNSFLEQISDNQKFYFSSGESKKTFICCDWFPELKPAPEYKYNFRCHFVEELKKYVLVRDSDLVAYYFYITKKQYMKITHNGKTVFFNEAEELLSETDNFVHAFSDSLRGYRVYPEYFQLFDLPGENRYLYCENDGVFYLHLIYKGNDYAVAPLFGDDAPIIRDKKSKPLAHGYFIHK